ncbi:MAG: cytochrome c [Chloroflexota bacterium]
MSRHHIFGIFAFSSWSVNQIDHANIGGENAPTIEFSPIYGKYLVDIASCAPCHGENFAGNTPDSDSPQGPNITPGGNPGSWSAEEFALAIRAGQTPEGRQRNTEMPWPNYAFMTEVEVEAIWAYLQSLDTLPDNS